MGETLAGIAAFLGRLLAALAAAFVVTILFILAFHDEGRR